MVNNFDQIEKLLKFEKEGDCYYVQLLRRQSDDPMIDGIPDPAYHGNMHSRSLKDYLISSIEHFQDLKKEMIQLCDMFNVRAYIRLNKRNYKNIALKMLRHISEQVESGETYSSPYHLVSSATGSVCQAGDEKTWIIDLDEEYLPHEETILRFISQCEPIATKIHENGVSWSEAGCEDIEAMENAYNEWRKNIVIIPTKHGHHAICVPFNKKTFADKWTEYCQANNITAPIPQTKFDETQIHFSLTDKYLGHVDSFSAILQSLGATVIITKMDKNKTIVHSSTNFNFSDLEKEWHKYCVEKSFWMKQPDVHKDNPTILYVP